MNLSSFSNLLDKKDFNEVKEELEKIGVKPIKYCTDKTSYNLHRYAFDDILKGFFNISQKNKVSNFKYFLCDFEKIVESDTTFRIDKLYEIQDNTDTNSKSVLTFSYLKDIKYCQNMLSPLKSIVDSPSQRVLKDILKRDSEELQITYYNFSCDGKHLEIVAPCQVFKNAIYGLSHYINYDRNLFANKEIAVSKAVSYKLDSHDGHTYMQFFKNLEMKGFEYILEGNSDCNKDVVLSIYKASSSFNKRERILVMNVENSFFKDFRVTSYILEKFLNMLISKNIKMDLYLNKNENIINVFVDGQIKFSFENSSSLLSNIILDICDDSNSSIFSRIIAFFSVNEPLKEIISRRDFFCNDKNRNMIINSIKKTL